MIPFTLYCNVDEDWSKLDEATIDFLRESLREFVEKAVDKFIRGQKEHGGNIWDRPMLVEIENEVIDQMFYLAALKKRLNEDVQPYEV